MQVKVSKPKLILEEAFFSFQNLLCKKSVFEFLKRDKSFNEAEQFLRNL